MPLQPHAPPKPTPSPDLSQEDFPNLACFVPAQSRVPEDLFVYLLLCHIKTHTFLLGASILGLSPPEPNQGSVPSTPTWTSQQLAERTTAMNPTGPCHGLPNVSMCTPSNFDRMLQLSWTLPLLDSLYVIPAAQTSEMLLPSSCSLIHA